MAGVDNLPVVGAMAMALSETFKRELAAALVFTEMLLPFGQVEVKVKFEGEV